MKIKDFFKRHQLLLCFCFFLFSFSLFLMIFLKMDIDYYWHFKAGEYMVEHSTILTHDIFSWSVIGKSWMSHEWLFEVLIYLLFTVFHSYHLFIYVFGICVVLLFFLFWVQRKEYLKNIPFALFWTSFYMLIFIGLSGRPHLLSYLLLAITLYLLFYYFYHPDSKRIYFLPLISLIWVNVHGGSSNLVYLFCFLFLLVGLVQFSFSKIEAKRLSRKQILTYLVVGLLSIFVLVINPHGLKMLLYPYQNMADTLMLSSISEWQPSNLNIPTHYIYYFFSLVVLIIMIFSKKKIRLLDAVIYLVFLYLGLKSIRFWFFSYLAYTFFIFYYIPKRKLDSHTCLLLVLCSCLFLFIFGSSFSYSKVISKKTLQDDCIEVLKEEKPKRLFNYYDYGAYLIYQDIPVFVDGRADLYSKYNYPDYLTISRLDYGYSSLIDKYQFDYFVIPRKSGLSTYLKDSDSYQLLYQDKKTVIFKTK